MERETGIEPATNGLGSGARSGANDSRPCFIVVFRYLEVPFSADHAPLSRNDLPKFAKSETALRWPVTFSLDEPSLFSDSLAA